MLLLMLLYSYRHARLVTRFIWNLSNEAAQILYIIEDCNLLIPRMRHIIPSLTGTEFNCGKPPVVKGFYGVG